MSQNENDISELDDLDPDSGDSTDLDDFCDNLLSEYEQEQEGDEGMISRITSTVAGIGSTMLGCVVLPILGIAFLLGALWVGDKALPWLMLFGCFVLLIDLLILVPLAIIRSTRLVASIGFVISSYVFGVTGWFLGLLLAWGVWGLVGIIVGLCFLGVGVVPVAILATLLHGMWLDLGALVLIVFLTFGSRFLGIFLAPES